MFFYLILAGTIIMMITDLTTARFPNTSLFLYAIAWCCLALSFLSLMSQIATEIKKEQT
jgi:hypothetical protein